MVHFTSHHQKFTDCGSGGESLSHSIATQSPLFIKRNKDIEIIQFHCDSVQLQLADQIVSVMSLSSTSLVNMAKSAGDVVSQVIVQPGIMCVQAFSDPCPQNQKKIAKNGQVFKQAVKRVITSAALLPKTWGEPSGSTQRLLDEAEAPWALEVIKPTLRIFLTGRTVELVIKHDQSSEELVQILVSIGLFEARSITVITHGFMTNGNFAWVTEMKDAIMAIEENQQTQNFVVILDWGGGAFIGPLAYDSAAQNIETVGKWLGGHVAIIREMAPHLHIAGIGHSLGAHLMGVAGRTANRTKPGCFDRITALDPAGPGFENYSGYGLDNRHGELRLDSTAAKFVDVIHTDGYSHALHTQAIISPTNHYGTLIPLGHVDFYPNWGHSQPGCVYNIIGSHLRSIDLFVWSIANPGKFVTNLQLVECPDYMEPAHNTRKENETAEMGFHCQCDGPRGNFYLETAEGLPWIVPSNVE